MVVYQVKVKYNHGSQTFAVQADSFSQAEEVTLKQNRSGIIKSIKLIAKSITPHTLTPILSKKINDFDTTYVKVKNIIVESLNIDESYFSIRSSLSEDLGADSLDQVELLLKLKDEFEISISDEEASKFKTVSDIVDYIVNSNIEIVQKLQEN